MGTRVLVRLIMGPLRPRRRILGQEFAGDVVECGSGVTRHRVGDAVYGTTGFRFGAYAEYLRLPESQPSGAIARKPARMTYEEAATVPTGGLEALQFLRKAGALNGRKLLVNGAGGGIGMPAVQLAKHYGAEVTGIDRPGKEELIRWLGANRFIDYTERDFADAGETYDVIFDVVGGRAFPKGLRALRSGGHYLLANPSLSSMFRGRWTSRRNRQTVIRRPLPPTAAALETLTKLIEAGEIRTVIDRRYPLDQVPDAHRYVESQAALGRVVILP